MSVAGARAVLQRVPAVVWWMLAGGLVIRVVLAFAFVGVAFDIDSLQVIQRELNTGSPFDVYGAANIHQTAGDADFLRWPYPPGFFSWIGVSAVTENVTGLPFHGLIQVLPIICDCLLALSVYAYLGRRGVAERLRLAAVALVALGPSFILISGYHGQIDSVAILPAVLALMLWERPGARDRAMWAGLLIGLGITMKWVPAFLLVALIPSASGPREMVRLVAFAALPPALALAPFALADFEGVRSTIGYSGAPGLGGLGLAFQPGLVDPWLTEDQVLLFSPVSQFLYDAAGMITVVALAILGVLLLRWRPRTIDAAVLVWLTVYAVAPNFFFQYLVWGIPFFLMAGYIRQVAVLQAVVLLPALIVYVLPPTDAAWGYVYVPIMLAVWLGWIASLLVLGRRAARGGRGGVVPAAVEPAA